MAVYRLFQIGFWHDNFVMELTPEERYFYFYLFTGPKTTQCGIYALPVRLAEAETGYNWETLEKLLQRFIERGKILYDVKTREIYLCDWARYNPITNTNVEKCVLRELKLVQNEQFRQLFLQTCEQLDMDVPLLRQHFCPTDEPEPLPEPAVPSAPTQAAQSHPVFAFYKEHFGEVSSYTEQELRAWMDELSEEIVLRALQVCYESGSRKLAYIKRLLQDWHSKGCTTLHDVEKVIAKHRSKEKDKPAGTKQAAEWQADVYDDVPSEGEVQQLLQEKGWQL